MIDIPTAIVTPPLKATTTRDEIANKSDKSRITEMARENRTPFEAIKTQYGFAEADVIRLTESELKPAHLEAGEPEYPDAQPNTASNARPEYGVPIVLRRIKSDEQTANTSSTVNKRKKQNLRCTSNAE